MEYLVCVDFEATCWEHNYKSYDKSDAEIIGKYTWKVRIFPAVLLNIKSGLIEAEFSHYVKPTKFPELSAYCKNLTGIAQADVDQALEIKEVLLRFDEWIQRFVEEKNLNFENGDDDVKQNAAICTWTDFDVGVYLKGECTRKSIELKSYFNRRIDASVVFQKWKRNYRRCKFTHALQLAGIHYRGRLHSGIDDARNLARLMAKIKMKTKGDPKYTDEHVPKAIEAVNKGASQFAAARKYGIPQVDIVGRW